MSKVMIVDDDPLVRASARRIVEAGGHEVVEAEDGRKALSLVDVEAPEVVLTDIFMPETDGLEVVRSIRRSRPDIRVLVMSGGGVFPAGSALDIALAMGATAALKKPFGPDEIRRYLGRPTREGGA